MAARLLSSLDTDDFYLGKELLALAERACAAAPTPGAGAGAGRPTTADVLREGGRRRLRRRYHAAASVAGWPASDKDEAWAAYSKNIIANTLALLMEHCASAAVLSASATADGVEAAYSTNVSANAPTPRCRIFEPGSRESPRAAAGAARSSGATGGSTRPAYSASFPTETP